MEKTEQTKILKQIEKDRERDLKNKKLYWYIDRKIKDINMVNLDNRNELIFINDNIDVIDDYINKIRYNYYKNILEKFTDSEIEFYFRNRYDFWKNDNDWKDFINENDLDDLVQFLL